MLGVKRDVCVVNEHAVMVSKIDTCLESIYTEHSLALCEELAKHLVSSTYGELFIDGIELSNDLPDELKVAIYLDKIVEAEMSGHKITFNTLKKQVFYVFNNVPKCFIFDKDAFDFGAWSIEVVDYFKAAIAERRHYLGIV